MEIRGAGALVTGGASGLGEATARMLASAGAAMTIVDLDEEHGKALAAELGNGASYARADVADEEQVAGAVAQAGASSPLRIVVNCAGIAIGERILARDGSAHDLGRFERVLRVNLVGTFNVLRLGAGVMAATDPLDDGERGVVVNTASVAAFEGQIGQAAYAASKGGVVSLDDHRGARSRGRRDPGLHDRAGHVRDADDGGSARVGTRVARGGDPVPVAAGEGVGVRGAGAAHLREHHAQRRDDPSRRGPAHDPR